MLTGSGVPVDRHGLANSLTQYAFRYTALPEVGPPVYPSRATLLLYPLRLPRRASTILSGT